MFKWTFIFVFFITISNGFSQDYPHGDYFEKDCSFCHKDDVWSPLLSPLLFNHDSTGFNLRGQHQKTDCRTCHTTLVFENVKKQCGDCHTDMHENTNGPDCGRCHNTRYWIIENVQDIHLNSRFPLLGAHASADCSSCHPSASLLRFEPRGVNCIDCHLSDYQSTSDPNHQEGGYPSSCLDCHNSFANSWSDTDFNHDGFPLKGGHSISCDNCHVSGTFTKLPKTCVSCHQDNYNVTQNPNHYAAGIPTTCEDCHTPAGFVPSDFDHASTGFTLIGGHTEITQCSDCHQGNLVAAVSECFSCHEAQYNSAPGHVSSNFPKTCLMCHNNDSWEDTDFDHNLTNFPLVGVHTETECAQCHTTGTYSGTPSLCVDCHQDNYNGAQNPSHTAAGIPTTCDDCHTPVGFVPSDFDHASTGFTLIGGHTEITQCSDCHQGNLVAAVSECFSCHEAQYNSAPGHVSSNFPKTCLMCHNNDSWEDTDFDHNLTNFPLVGVHTETECAQCHTTGTYSGTPSLCVDCHQDNYNGAQNPSHTAAGIPTTCDDCHTPVGFVPSDFDHASTGFTLIGGHTEITQCSDCHQGNLVAAVSECFSCHEAQYNSAPGHVSSNFPKTCLMCHNNDSWEDTDFDHSLTNFPLVGVHTETECAQCHTTGTYSGTPSLCVDCHQDNYNGAQNPSHTAAGIPTTCDDCHTPVGFVPSDFDHASTGFTLIGGHTEITQCSDCHQGNLVAAVSECFSCHEAQYNGAPGHVDSNFPKECLMCHNNDSWEDTDFDHSLTNFPLVGVHTETECAQCHTTGTYSGTPSLCVDCHQDNYTGTQNPNHSAAGIPTTCDDCHTPAGFVPSEFDHASTGFTLIGGHTEITQCSDCHQGNLVAAVSECFSCHEAQYNSAPGHVNSNFPKTCLMCHNNDSWEDTDFDHNLTNFPLVGVHTETECAQCHTTGTYTGTPSLCVDCHQDNYNGAQNPSHTAAGIPTTCEDCHTPAGFVPSEFDHASTGFTLIGGHTVITQCSDCHQGNLVAAVSECFSCHEAQYNSAPGHVNSNFPKTCLMCHNNDSWEDTDFDHNLTNFPLVGVHTETECAQCHTTGTYTGTPSLCVDCHQDNYNGAQNPSHTAAGIPTTCEDCHTPAGFVPSEFDHASTGFTLIGGHTQITQCSDCHQGNLVAAVSECFSCHEAQYNSTPGHVNSNFPKTCLMCHNNDSWEDTDFDHNNTNFPLVGVHTETECAQCHTTGTYTGTPSLCVDCHQDNYNGAQNPSHTAAGIPTTCEDCHTPAGFVPSEFDHASTGFTLIGGHTQITQCSDCHQGTVLTAVSDCFSCHETQYNGAPGHVDSNFPKECLMCHNNNSFEDPNFDHNNTNFPLTGTHTTTECSLCHSSGYVNTPDLCIDCHQANYAGAQNPNHTAAGIPTTCDDCHNTTAFIPSDFDHSTTGFTIYGGHNRVEQCSDCHLGSLVTTTSDCISCHQSQYDIAPGHVDQSFPYECDLCHSRGSWSGASFDHDQTNFVLTGAHLNTECLSCHSSGYTGTSTLCFDCHQANYNGTQEPTNHSLLGLSTNCEDCHNSNNFYPSTFDHDGLYFSIESNTHEGKWSSCSECHVVAGVITQFSCIDCHEHNNETELRQDHSGEEGFEYNSYACLACHRNE